MTFVKSFELNVNWLLNQVIGGGKTNFQITKVDNEVVLQFIHFLRDNPFDMPNGENALRWVRARIELRYDQCQNALGQQWELTRQRYRFIMSQIDLILCTMPPPEPKIKEQPTMKVSFEEPTN